MITVDNLELRVNSIFIEFLGYLPYSEDSSIEVEAKTDAVKSLIALIQDQQKALVDQIIEQVNKDTYLYANNSHVGRVRKTIITKLNQINQDIEGKK